MKKYRFGVFQFVLTDKRFGFIDKLLYFGYILVAALAVYFLIRSFWVNLEVNLLALGALLALLPFSRRIRTRFTDPYVLLTKGEEKMNTERDMALKTMELGQKTMPTILKAEVSGGVVALGVMIIFFGTILLFHFSGLASSKIAADIFLFLLLIEIILGIYFVIKVVNKSYKPLVDPAFEILKDKSIPLKSKIIGALIVLVITGLILYRVFLSGG